VTEFQLVHDMNIHANEYNHKLYELERS